MRFIDGAAMRPVKDTNGWSWRAVNAMSNADDHPQKTPSFISALLQWARIGLLSFGGPAAQIALMHRVVVDEKRWLTESQYLNALSFCMLLPGPEAMQLATYAGWRLHGTRGGLAAGLLFVLPGALVVLALASVYAAFGSLPLVTALFFGIKAAVLVIVIEALIRISKRALTGRVHLFIAATAFIGIFFLQLPFPLIIAVAAATGFFLMSGVVSEGGGASGEVAASNVSTRVSRRGMLKNTVFTVFVWLCIWFAPLVLLAVVAQHDLLSDIGLFFSRLAVVTFGGAYAVLAYLAQDVVTQFGWLSAGEMMDGLALAETTPGPLILVTEFVGFIAGFRDGGWPTGFAAAALTLWVTFVPCFLWIFAGAPYIEWIARQPRLRSALTAITAAVVGVMLNLSLWFALHVFFRQVNLTEAGVLAYWQPVWSTLDWRVPVLTAICALLVFVWHWGIARVLLVASALGVLLQQIPG
jgi:chromate transporter